MVKLVLILGIVAVFSLMLIGCIGAAEKRVWPFEENCGKHKPLKPGKALKKNLVAGGFEIGAEYFPSFAHLELVGKNGENWTCPGVLVSDQYVLVHLKCNARFGYEGATRAKVTLGLGSKSERQFVAGESCSPVPIRLCDFEGDNDVHLFKLKERVEYDDNIQPACLFNFILTPDEYEGSGVTKSIQAYLVVNSANTNEDNGDNDEEAGERHAAKKPQGLRVVPVRKKFCPSPQCSPPLCMKPNKRRYLGSPCKDDFGAPLLATINGKHEVMGLLASFEGICQANSSEVNKYLPTKPSSHYIYGATKYCSNLIDDDS